LLSVLFIGSTTKEADMKKLASVLCLLVALGLTSLAAAQDSTQRDEGSATIQGKSGAGSVDIRVQGPKDDKAERSTQPSRDTQGPVVVPGPQGQPGPQGPAGPSGGTTVLGMDPTIALLVGLGVLAVVIVAIVASSRGGHEVH
jgi:hypothetical protein